MKGEVLKKGWKQSDQCEEKERIYIQKEEGEVTKLPYR